MAIASFGEALPEARGRRVGREGGGADRFAEERGDVPGTCLVQRTVERLERRLAGRVEPPRARRDVQVLRQIGTERPVQPRPPGQREGLHRRAVVRLRRRDHLPSIGLASLDVVAPRDLDRHLVGVGAAHGEPRPREAFRRHRDELLRETLLRGIREALVVHEGELFRLGPRRGDDVLPAVPEGRGHRATAHRVQVPAARRVLDPDAVASDDHGHLATELQREHMRPVASDRRLVQRSLLRRTDRPGHRPRLGAQAYGNPRACAACPSPRSSVAPCVAGQHAATV